MNLNNDLKNFKTDGYVLLKSHVPSSVMETLKNHHNRVFPNFEDGINLNPEKSREISFYQNHSFFDNNTKTRFDGIPLEHRIFRGQGSPNISDTPNVYYGKRASKNLIDLDNQTFDCIFYKDLLEASSSLLETNSLSYLEGSANRTFPRYPGFSTRPHIDTYGFTYGNNTILDEDNYFINVLIYINGSDEGRAPTLIIPKSHKRYHEVNKAVANALNLSDKTNHIHQAELYWEILPDDMKENIISVNADPGDVLIINSNLVHSITGNDNYTKHRDVVILNFAKENASHFGKARSEDDFIKMKTKLMPHNLSLSNLQKPSLLKRISNIKTTKFIIKNILNRIKISTPSLNKRLPLDEMPYLNIGSGTHWNDPKTIGLDINGDPSDMGVRNKSLCDVEFDLSSKEPLPFSDNRFEGVYTSHTFEHLADHNAKHCFKEIYRVLKSKGTFRITVPNMDLYLDAYDNKDLSFFNWIRQKNVYAVDSWLRFITREFAGAVVDDYTDEELIDMYKNLGRSEYLNFFQKEQNECLDSYKNIPDIHKSFWTPKKMTTFLKEAGFKNIYQSERFKSNVKHFGNKKNTGFNRTRPAISLYIEGIK
jgi:ubiquinone/menaquinone biosynthesis C-methylase UbiE